MCADLALISCENSAFCSGTSLILSPRANEDELSAGVMAVLHFPPSVSHLIINLVQFASLAERRSNFHICDAFYLWRVSDSTALN